MQSRANLFTDMAMAKVPRTSEAARATWTTQRRGSALGRTSLQHRTRRANPTNVGEKPRSEDN